MNRINLLPLGICLLLLSRLSVSDVVFDGSTGTAGPATSGPSGADFEISEADGRVSGSTLLHSFSEFSISSNERAAFTGSNPIRVVINRVTGSSASNINGRIESLGMNADFYFVNPNGVILGTEAQIQTSGAFNVIRTPLPGIERISAFGSTGNPSAATLTILDPERLTFIFDEARATDVNTLLTQKCAAAELTDRSSFVVGRGKPGPVAPTSYELAGSGSELSVGDAMSLAANCLQ